MNYVQIVFEINNTDQSDKLVALLAELGFEGFEETPDSLNAFIPETDFCEEDLSGVIALFAEVTYSKSIVENINWNKEWEDDFKPVVIDDFVGIRAHFHPHLKNVMHEIIITPKMSFGTGHHATTFLMISQMKQLDFVGKSVLDFGTGTGILAILARKLKAVKVLAVDYDDWSIANTIENIQQNDCSDIHVLQSESIPAGEKFDIILANINLNVIIYTLSSIVTSSFRGTKILLSGFLKENEVKLVDEVEKAGLKYLSTIQKGDWIAVIALKP